MKEPIGRLLLGKPKRNAERLKDIIENKRPPLWASVGDFVSRTVLEAGLEPNIIVIDNRIMRISIEPIQLERNKMYVTNCPGTINYRACKTLEKAISLKKKLAVIVKGEEDLLVLPLMAMMPLGSLIVYGQPDKGVVVVSVNKRTKKWVMEFMGKMEERKSETRINIYKEKPSSS